MFRNILAVELSTKLCESFHWCVLQFGDQLHEVNGFSFLSIPHRQAVAILARNTSLSILYKVACVLHSVQCTVQYSTVQYTVQVRTSLCYNLRTRSLGLAVLQLEGLQASAVEAG